MDYQTTLRETLRERARYLLSLGTPANIDLPGGNQGLPRWPSERHNYIHVASREGTNLIASDGLSDPFEQDKPVNGFGMECFAETTDDIGENPYLSWLFSLVFQASENAAYFGGFRSELEKRDLLVMELTGVIAPEKFMTPSKTVGVMLGITAPNRQLLVSLPLTDALYISVKLLTAKELAYIVERDTDVRKREIADQFISDGSYHLSSIER